jgi:RNA polymerase sigma-70 factor (ECF subfamily)
MCNTVVIAGILTAWPVGETSVEETRRVQERPQEARATALHIHTTHTLVVPAMTTREVERAHAGMRTKKTTGAINQIPARDIPADATKRVPAHAGVLDFGALYEKFSRPIHSYIYRLLGSQEDADDVTQEVFTRAYVSWNDLYDRDNLSPWLYRIATNLCVDQLRRRKRISWWPLTRDRHDNSASDGREEDMSYLPPNSGGIPEVGEREHIQRALANMPRDYAVALVLSAAQGVPYQEIGEILGISPNAAATRISRAKRLFMEVYQRFNDEGAGKQER